MSAIFQLQRNDDQRFFFHLLDGEGRVLLMSGAFSRKADAEQAIQAVRVGSLMSNQIAAGKVAAGESFFVIKDDAGIIIAKSGLFASRMVFDNALHAVKDGACVAEISDLT